MANSEHIGLFFQKKSKEHCPICFLFVVLYSYFVYKGKDMQTMNGFCGKIDPIAYKFAILGHLETGLGIEGKVTKLTSSYLVNPTED